jgi:carbonic anhydrase/acetyltransferase-like protein (isoleucine patch superfamily)
MLPVLGKPLVHRLVDRLHKAGVDGISVLNAADPTLPLVEEASAGLNWKDVAADQVWRAAEEEFDSLVQKGAEMVIVIRLGAYAEVDVDALLQFHIDKKNHVTRACAPDGALDLFVLSASRRNDVAFLFRNQLTKLRIESPQFLVDGYVNRLRDTADLRRLTLDSFGLRTQIQPVGGQFRPGVWVAPGAKMDRGVRLVAPCYIGAASRIRSGSLITRGSSIEHHCVVDSGSVVEASTLLPLSYLGAGLDLTHSVLGFKKIASLKYSAELEVEDGKLVGAVPPSPALRTLSHAANLLSFVPRQIVQSLVGGRKQRKSQVDADRQQNSFDPSSVADAVPQDRQPLTPSVAGMRRYGNQ